MPGAPGQPGAQPQQVGGPDAGAPNAGAPRPEHLASAPPTPPQPTLPPVSEENRGNVKNGPAGPPEVDGNR